MSCAQAGVPNSVPSEVSQSVVLVSRLQRPSRPQPDSSETKNSVEPSVENSG